MDYDKVLEESKIDPEKGAYRWQWTEYLRKKHYYGKWNEFQPVDTPPKTWAAIHMCSYMSEHNPLLGHMVVVYQGTTVFDPDKADTYDYKALRRVKMLSSVYAPYFMQPASFSGLLGK
jgi:hypothetical protein